jgi:hypothetical protein
MPAQPLRVWYSLVSLVRWRAEHSRRHIYLHIHTHIRDWFCNGIFASSFSFYIIQTGSVNDLCTFGNMARHWLNQVLPEYCGDIGDDQKPKSLQPAPIFDLASRDGLRSPLALEKRPPSSISSSRRKSKRGRSLRRRSPSSDSAQSVILSSHQTLQTILKKTATKYLEPDFLSSLHFDSELGLAELLSILKRIDDKHEEDQESITLSLQELPKSSALVKLREIYDDHEKDLGAVHDYLIGLHRRDLPRATLRIEYGDFQALLGLLHFQLQELHARHATQKSRVLLEEAYQSHATHLDELHKYLLASYEGTRLFFGDSKWPLAEQTKLNALHLGLLKLHKQVARRDSLAYYPCEISALSSQGSIEGEVQIHNLDLKSAPETQFTLKDTPPNAPMPEICDHKAQSAQGAGDFQPALEHAEAWSNTNAEGRRASFTGITQTIRAYFAQRLLEPPLGAGEIRLRWTCVSVSFCLNAGLVNEHSGVGNNCMMISKKLVRAQQKCWQDCLTILQS